MSVIFEAIPAILADGERVAFIEGNDNYVVMSSGRLFSAHGGKGWKEIKPVLQSNGYCHVTLCKNGQKTVLGFHVLIAKSFCPGFEPGMIPNHKNFVRHDNRAENLEWSTQSQNVRHAYEHGRRVIDEEHRARCAALGKAKKGIRKGGR